MTSLKELEAQYQANKVEGRGIFCPRKGTYLIKEVYSGTCYKKEALLAKAQWKPNVQDDYHEEFSVEIQLESFKSDTQKDSYNWVGRELLVVEANYEKVKREFKLQWDLVAVPTISIDELNKQLAAGNFSTADSLLHSLNGLDLEDGEVDYGEVEDPEY